MKYLRALGNGSCLFISLRLGLELLKVIEVKKPGVLDGRNSVIVKSAEDLRVMIVNWYANGLKKPVESFGSFEEKSEKQWTREDIIATELHNLSPRDVPESGPERLKAVLMYLEKMKTEGTWGGTPEYTAFAFMAKCNINVWSEGKIINDLKVTDTNKTINLLFSGRNHYDLLLSDEQVHELYIINPRLVLQDYSPDE
jgi:hypothetical protein